MSTLDDDQIEQLRRVWDRYGRVTVVVAVAVVVGLLGGRFYGQYQGQQAQQAAALYATYQQPAPAQADDVADVAEQLREQYPASSYAAFAALDQARQAVQDGDLDVAERHLRWVVANAAEPADRGLAGLRLARVLLARGDVAAAKEAVADKAITPSPVLDEIKGDIALAEGKSSQARDHYQQALAGLTGDAGAAALINLKLDALGNRE